jgi:5'-nucleotidase / UDP-sugar diphosphatase
MDRLAICAITTKISTEQSSSPMEDTTFDEEISAATECVAEVNELGVNKILLMTHVGYNFDLSSLATIPGVDIVVGGHSHTLLANQTKLGGTPFTTSGPYATIVNKTCVVQAWEYNRGVGSLDVEFDTNGEVVTCLGQLTFPLNAAKFTKTAPAPSADINSTDAQNVVTYLESFGSFKSTPNDAALDTMLAPFRANLTTLQNQKIADVPVKMCHSRGNGAVDTSCPGKEVRTAVGGGVCHIVAQSFLYNVRQAEVAIQNGGGCRVSINVGNFTIGNAFTVLPFSNTLVTLKMSGDQIRRVLEDAVNFSINGGGSGPYPFSAGLRWRLDYSKPFGSRFSDIQVNKRLNSTWGPLIATETYTVVTTNFIATPRDGYFAFNETDKNDPTKYTDTYFVYAQSLIDYAKFLGTLNDPPAHQYSTQYFVSASGTIYDLGPEISPRPTKAPTNLPTVVPVPKPITSKPTSAPTKKPSNKPTKAPTKKPYKMCIPQRSCRSSAQCCGRRCSIFRRCT